MVYHFETYLKREEEYAEKRCRETRQECGLPVDMDGCHCEDEPCQLVCPFLKEVII